MVKISTHKQSKLREEVEFLLKSYQFSLIISGKDFDVFIREKYLLVFVEYNSRNNKYHILLLLHGSIEKVMNNIKFEDQNDILKYLLDYL